jgi:hypothetical protein
MADSRAEKRLKAQAQNKENRQAMFAKKRVDVLDTLPSKHEIPFATNDELSKSQHFASTGFAGPFTNIIRTDEY